MKKSKNIVLVVTPVLSAALFNGCGGSSQPRPLVSTTPTVNTPNPIVPPAPQTAQTRDVYNNLDDCVKDWLDKELCEQMSEEDDLDYKKKYKTSRTGKFFYGPGYSSSNRIIVYKGKTITPTGKAATKMPTFVGSVPAAKTTTGTTASTSSTTKSSTLPSSSTTSKSASTSTTSPSSTTSSSSSTTSPSSTSTYSPYSSSSSTTRSGFGSTSSSYSSSSSSGS